MDDRKKLNGIDLGKWGRDFNVLGVSGANIDHATKLIRQRGHTNRVRIIGNVVPTPASNESTNDEGDGNVCRKDIPTTQTIRTITMNQSKKLPKPVRECPRSEIFFAQSHVQINGYHEVLDRLRLAFIHFGTKNDQRIADIREASTVTHEYLQQRIDERRQEIIKEIKNA